MAGLGETCTHVAATLFYLEAVARHEERTTCTGAVCLWKIPAYQKEMEYASVKDIDFSSAKRKQRDLDSPSAPSSPVESRHVPEIRAPTDTQKSDFLKAISSCGSKPAILSLCAPYSDLYVPKSTSDRLPLPLSSLYDKQYLHLEYGDLLTICKALSETITLTEAQCIEVERATRAQSGSRIWFTQRAARVTASRMYDVCHTSLSAPAHSLVRSICYPAVFSSAATDWGTRQEGPARIRYMNAMVDEHEELSVSTSGFVINKDWPFIGASPDGVVSCKCCGTGVLEIKCPYKLRSESLEVALQDKAFCLESCGDSVRLKRSHPYFLQVQTQLFVCDVEYCDFCVCLFTEEDDIHIERVLRDKTVWQECLGQCTDFFVQCLLPELVAKWFTSAGARLSRPTGGLQSVLPTLPAGAPFEDSLSASHTDASLSTSQAAASLSVPCAAASSCAPRAATSLSAPYAAASLSASQLQAAASLSVPRAAASLSAPHTAASVSTPHAAAFASTISFSDIPTASALPSSGTLSIRCCQCGKPSPPMLRSCRRCSSRYHHMCQTADEDGKLCDTCCHLV